MKRIILSVLMAFILVMPCFAIEEENFCKDQFGEMRDCEIIYLEKMAAHEEARKQKAREELRQGLFIYSQIARDSINRQEYYNQQRVLHSMPQTYNLNIRSY
jgi:hypothetical protein